MGRTGWLGLPSILGVKRRVRRTSSYRSWRFGFCFRWVLFLRDTTESSGLLLMTGGRIGCFRSAADMALYLALGQARNLHSVLLSIVDGSVVVVTSFCDDYCTFQHVGTFAPLFVHLALNCDPAARASC